MEENQQQQQDEINEKDISALLYLILEEQVKTRKALELIATAVHVYDDGDKKKAYIETNFE